MNTSENIEAFKDHIQQLRASVDKSEKNETEVETALEWLKTKRVENSGETKLVKIPDLADWLYSEDEGIVRNKKGADYFFSVQGVIVEQAKGTEVAKWNQPIIVQKDGGFLVILCQERDGEIKFLLHAKFEAGNISGVQLGPTIQATYSNLAQHHNGSKPRFSEYIQDHPNTTLIYSARHNEEGARFWQKSNVNSLILLNKDEELEMKENDDYIWLSLQQIKTLMLHDHVINPFVKTILSPL